jgi:hypothetical protein
MNYIESLNTPVEVITVFRTGIDNGKICYPAKMKYRNQEIVFTELGLRHPTAKGKRMIHVFDMTDGKNDYRLEFDAEYLTWKLMSILEGHYES